MVHAGEDKQSAEELFEQFLRYDALGMRKKAQSAVFALIKDIPDDVAKDAWTKENLSRMPRNKAGRVRHEIFKEIVFPSLKKAFDRGDAEASYLLGLHSQNLHSDRTLHSQVDQCTELDFFRKAFESDANSTRYQSAYLGAVMDSLLYCFHEWPAGILIDTDDWRKGLESLREQLSLAQSLDRKNEFSGRITQWLSYIDEYETRLTAT